MRVLLVSKSPLKREVASGNTFLNLFEDIDSVELAAVCTKKDTPDVLITKCYCMTERMLLDNMLRKSPIGTVLDTKGRGNTINSGLVETVAQKTAEKVRWTVFFWLQDMLWRLANWKTSELTGFIEEFKPDIIFTVFTNYSYLNQIIMHTHSLSTAKLVLYAWDNTYSLKQFMLSPWRWIKHFIDREYMRRLASKADLFYVISDIQKKDYEKYFNMKCKVLTKGTDFSEPPAFKGQYNTPLQLVFTGNIALNRWKSLKLIADALETINKEGIKAQLRIYSSTPLTRKMIKALNRGESSFFMGSVSASEVPALQENADILVHVEAMDLKNKLIVRQSFSTKIVDYLKAARPILAVGPKDVASIDHLIRNDCAIVASNRKELEDKLSAVLSNESELNRIAQNAYECGKRHHNKQDIQTMLMNDLREVCSE